MLDSVLNRLEDALERATPKTIDNPTLVPAGVLVLLYLKNGEPHLLLNKRSESVESHKGEISFPGGRKDLSDNSLLDTALRETYEEIGVNPEDVRVLGEMDEIDTMTGYRVSPFLATISERYRFIVNRLEVAELIEVPLFGLMKGALVRDEMRQIEGNWVHKNNYSYNGHLIWGATARIVNRLLVLLQPEFDKEPT